jgi:cytosine/adenosine deaminase-related metal-dependent hydrolase
MDYISGKILTKNGLEEGYIGIYKFKIEEIGKGKPIKKPKCKGLIVPRFVNAHTHIGDSFIKEKKIKLPKNIKDLVAPPNGLKYRLLNKASHEELIKGMGKSIKIMIDNGIELFCDFRENGIMGICLLKTSLQFWKISSIILSRPDELKYNKNEIDILLNNSDGIGVSSVSDWDYSELEKVAKLTKDKEKIFAIHASERKRENIDKILDLKPNFLVHMIKANENDLEICKQENIPIIICPRSNAFYGLSPDYNLLKRTKVDLILGSDNAMLNSPNILEELKFVRYKTNIFSNESLLNMITYIPRKALNLDSDILDLNKKAEFVVINEKSLEPLYISI